MKKRLVLCLIPCAVMIRPVLGDDELKQYPFKSAVITYKIGGSLQQGTEKTYITDYGKKKCTERQITMNIMGMKQKEHTLEIDDGTHLYRIDLEKKTGVKMPSYSRTAEEMFKSMSPEQKKAMEDLGKELVKGLTGETEMKPVGTGKVLGRECEIYDVLGVKTWQWKNLTLKMKSPALGDMLQEAIELKIDQPIPAERFEPPSEISITEVSPASALQAQTPDTLPSE